MNILESLIADARQSLRGCEKDLRIDNILLGKTLYTMKGAEKVFTDMNFCMVLLENAYGFSYFQSDINYSLSKIVNQNALDVVDEVPIYTRVAIIDAAYCLINGQRSKDRNFLVGNIRQKAQERARILLAHIPRESRILLFGAVTELVEEAERKRCHIRVFDLEKQKIGVGISSITVDSGEGRDLQRAIEECDYVVATGMVFVSQTADNIFQLASKNRKKLTLFMETGSNFGPQLLNYGADVVLSETFPFYDFFGNTEYSIYRK